jgi:hypothetical protein
MAQSGTIEQAAYQVAFAVLSFAQLRVGYVLVDTAASWRIYGQPDVKQAE